MGAGPEVGEARGASTAGRGREEDRVGAITAGKPIVARAALERVIAAGAVEIRSAAFRETSVVEGPTVVGDQAIVEGAARCILNIGERGAARDSAARQRAMAQINGDAA